MKMDEIEKEKDRITRKRYITLAILAGCFAILTTLLQVDTEIIRQSTDLKIAISIFCIVIPYLILDVHFLNLEKIDGKIEVRLYKIMRVAFWLLGGYGMSRVFNFLPGFLNKVSNFQLLIYSFMIFLIIRSAPIFIEELKRLNNTTKKNKR